ncbi:O-antigen ligase family protein [Acinetobacter pseudolwoffii]|uniref:O-antigen ligase family protein n=1 Tax=Acinetobacter pseudolwoffii TaxID=2053287 RepID=UPI000944FEE9|nr:O-antigen ligase family protein [Acinetobacter pseudolwoffii]
MSTGFFSYNGIVTILLFCFLYFGYFSNFLFSGFDISEIVQFGSLLLLLIFLFLKITILKIKNIILLFFICLMLSALYLTTIVNEYFVFDLYKTLKFILIFFCCGIIGVFLAQGFNIEKLSLGFFLLSSLFAILTIFFGEESSSGNSRVVLGDMNPIWNARLLGVGLLYTLIQLFIFKKINIIYILLALMSTYAILKTGSRGPIVGIVVAFVFISAYMNFNNIKKIFIGAFFAFSCFLACLYIIEKTNFFANLNIFDLSSGRTLLYDFALNLFFSNPFGIGLGGFDREFNVEGLAYPHNIFLESLVETGLLFTFGFFVLILYAFNRAVRVTQTNFSYFVFLFSLLIYSFVNAMFSGDLTSPKELYILIFFFLFTFKNKVSHKYG